MSLRYGKKIGKLEVKLDRKKTRYKWATVDVELRFEIANGTFYAQWEGNWYSAKTKDDLAEQIKVAATKSLSIEWKRYIDISYVAEGWPIADEKSGRPARQGQYHSFDIDEDRSRSVRGRDADEKFAICAIKIHWSICEISAPYSLPEEPGKRVRARRSVEVCEWGPGAGKEQVGDPQEWEDDVLPAGTLLWTPEREAVLTEIVAALGRLDARLVDLFRGDAATLAEKIDAAAQTDASRLLAAPDPVHETEPSAARSRSDLVPSSRRRRRE